jgi:hypothetical protein
MDNSSQPPTKKHSTMLSLHRMKQFNDQHLLHGSNEFEATINANNTTNENINNIDINNISQNNNNNPNINNKNYIINPIDINKLKSQIYDTSQIPNTSQQSSTNNNNNNNNNIITMENHEEDIDQSMSSIKQ